MGDDGVVFSTVNFDCVFCARVDGKGFVAKIGMESGCNVRVLGLEGGGNGDVLQGVAVEKFLRALPRVVRGVEGEVHEEGFCVVLSGFFGGVAEEVYGVVGENFRPVFASLPEAAEFGVGGVPQGWLAFNGAVIAEGAFVFWHSGANAGDVVEEVFGGDADVPFPGEVGFVSERLHSVGPEGGVELVLLGGGLFFEISHSLAGGVGSPKCFAGDEHGSGGDADGARPGSHVEAMGELDALAGKLV